MKPFFDVFHAKRPTVEYLAELHRTQAALPITYSEIGATLGQLPSGWHHLHATRTVSLTSDVTSDVTSRVSSDVDAFARGQEAIRAWAGHRELNLLLEPSNPPLVEGSVVVFALPMKPSPLWATGACRIVRVVDEPNRFGFVYGTLPHHPECGEEAFLVEREAGERNTITFTITAFSRGAKLPTKVGGPIGRQVQRRSAETYLTGYEKFVRNQNS